MSTLGLISMVLAGAATFICIVLLVAGHILRMKEVGRTLTRCGRLASVFTFGALTVACGVLVYCFLADNYSIQYVLDNHVTQTGFLGTLYRISGLWAGRSGSLLFWAWLISLFDLLVSVRRAQNPEEIDNIAALVIQVVLMSFLGIMLFSDTNMPFLATSSAYYNENGTLNSAASLLGMNTLLQHWAMAIHPPMLFLGYAGLTVPFAHAIAACVVNDSSSKWIVRSERYAIAAWLFLTIGIGLGSIWAYACLGWGGFWGWDPVENASLLPWLVCVALLHSFNMYKKRGTFKCSSIMCACLAFMFCILGAFISRSGLVQSVHAFSGDSVSLVLFAGLIIVSLLAGIVCCIWRRKSFGDAYKDEATEEIESMFSKDGAHFISNVVMVVIAVLLAYLTVAQTLPSWLPFGGTSVSSGTYEMIARPLGAIYLLMMAICPLLGWCKTNRKMFFKRAKAPAICALVLFALLAVYLALVLIPTYNAIVAAGGTTAEAITEQGPKIYYLSLALFAFLVASLLIFNSGCQFVRTIKSDRKCGIVARLGSCVAHLAMGFIVIGLIGSSMFVTEVNGYVAYNEESDECTETFEIGSYKFEFDGSSERILDDYSGAVYEVSFKVYKDGYDIATIKPNITLVMSTQQEKYNTCVISLPQEDLFVAYQGYDEDNGLHLDVRINPLISVVWIGFILLCLGMFISLIGCRNRPENSDKETAQTNGNEANIDVKQTFGQTT